ncbi:hypothetical protein NIIDMKKI_03840 [Mycobacterium kansasii]|uniref:Acyl-CoA dehydrogenase/oxidase C-terminal domain-containing protein n=1 Tax=Mycobacterium kansasii TaxID=1768 RepID=A0A7G1I9L2_MYCKA|nr:hypothetical protein NIIDMKKI_03840 [Mycobacterium kansasii]
MSVTALQTTGLGSVGHLALDGVTVDGSRLVAHGDALSWLRTMYALGRSAFQLGVLERGLQMTAEYARTREQFDRPIGSFQAVGQRLADGYIDVKGLRLTLTQAAWKVAEDLPAELDVASAAFWAADAGHRVAHTIVHVHGGVGVDTDHPVHRYFWQPRRPSSPWAVPPGSYARSGVSWQRLPLSRDCSVTVGCERDCGVTLETRNPTH